MKRITNMLSVLEARARITVDPLRFVKNGILSRDQGFVLQRAIEGGSPEVCQLHQSSGWLC